jgi:mono/diheme cytochrome c family protein
MRQNTTLRTLAIAATVTCLAGGAVFAATAADASAPTYTEHVRPILTENCVTCHRPSGLNLGGMIAPMSFATYDEVRPWAKSIAKAVASREMPPWHASEAQHGQFRNERSLSADEIEAVVAWAKNGATRGEGADVAQTFETNADGWSIGEPDLVIPMAEPFFVEDGVDDLYVDIEVPVPDELIGSDRWIEALEFKAGSSAVHHLIAYGIRPGGSKIDPGVMLGGIAPGADPDRFPPGYARLWEKGSTLLFEMHYHKEAGAGTGVSDQSVMAIKFADGPVTHRVMNDNISDYAFEIPAGAADHEVRASYTFKKDVELLSLLPHMHLRGKASQYIATYPDGRQEMLLDVPRYDFNWQTSYYYEQPKRLPAGTRVEVVMQYDNSADNPANPDATVAVRYGEPTTDEMMNGFLNFTNATPHDFELEGPLTDIDWTLFGSESGGS